MIDVDYTDDIALLANITTQAEFFLDSLEQAAESSVSTWTLIK